MKVAADQGRNGPDQRQQSTQSGALPATDNSQPTNRSTSRPEGAGSRRRRQLTGRRRRQSGRPERPSRPNRRPAKDTARPADQPPDTTRARARHTTSNSKHKKHHRFTKMRRGGRPAQGGTPATVGSRWPGYRQARPPQGRQSRLRGACLGLAGRQTGRQSRPQAAFPRAPPRANARGGGACAASARGGLNCGPPQRREPNDRRKPGESLPPAGGRAPEGRLGASGRSPEAQAPKGRYAGRRVRRQSRAARPAPQAWPGWQGWPERRRPGRRGGRPHSPHIVGAGPPRSTNAATGAGLAGGKAREAAPQGLGLAAGLGGPAQRLAAGLA